MEIADAPLTYTLDLKGRAWTEGIRSHPETCLDNYHSLGVRRIVVHGSPGISKDGEMDLVCRWQQAARERGISMLLYTGLFGGEYGSYLEERPDAERWLQRRSDGQEAERMWGFHWFCPCSDYLEERRLPVMKRWIQEADVDGFFIDVPWISPDGCFCSNCSSSRDKEPALDSPLTGNERIARYGFERAADYLYALKPGLRIAVNAGACGIWNAAKHGATPAAMAGVFDELLVEWTPSGEKALANVERSIRRTRRTGKTYQISHYCLEAHSHACFAGLRDIYRRHDVDLWTNEAALMPRA